MRDPLCGALKHGGRACARSNFVARLNMADAHAQFASRGGITYMRSEYREKVINYSPDVLIIASPTIACNSRSALARHAICFDRENMKSTVKRSIRESKRTRCNAHHAEWWPRMRVSDLYAIYRAHINTKYDFDIGKE